MFARVTSAQGAPEKVDQGVALLRERIEAGERPQGLQGVYLLIDRTTGKHLTVSLWATRDDAEAAGAIAARMSEAVVEAFGISGTPTHEIYEVAVQA